jgi:glycosyltransferase involved in cell wall biosynthesis
VAHIVIDARHRQSSTGRYVDRLMGSLQELDRTNRFTVLLAGDDVWRPASENFSSMHVSFPTYSVSEQLGLWRTLRRLRADLVHFAMPQQPLLYGGRTVTTIHDLTLVTWKNYRGNRLAYDIRQAAFRLLLRRVARRSSAVITPSAFTRSALATFADIPEEDICVTHEAGDFLADDAVPVPALAGQRFVLYVGNAFPYKNLAVLLEAWAEARPSHSGVQLVLVGRRSEFYEDLARRAPPSVSFLHDVDDGHLRWLYEHADLFVFPSLSEGFGLPGLEAMVHGCPVLSSRATSLPEVYGDAARYFDAHDSAALAAEMSRLLDDHEARATMSAAGRDRARRFSWRRTAEVTLQVYARVLAADG